MGINSWLKIAVLSLLLTDAQAAYRTNFNPTSQQVIKNALPGGQVLNSGTAVVMYGPEAVYALDVAGSTFGAGDSIKPTVRPVPVSTVGNVYFPNGAGAALPGATIPPSSAAPLKIKVKPKVTVPKSVIAGKLKGFVKNSGPQIILSAAISGAVAAVGWVMSDDQTQAKKKVSDGEAAPVTVHGYKGINTTAIFPSGEAAFASYEVIFQASDSRFIDKLISVTPGTSGGIVVTWTRTLKSDLSYVQTILFTLSRSGTCAPPLAMTASFICVDPSKAQFAFLTDTDLNALDSWASGAASAENLYGVLKDICDKALSPASCYQEVEDRSLRHLSGPATAAGPSSSTSSTYTKTDGTTGTKTKTDTTNFTFNYGNNYFDTTTNTTTTTATDGVTTGTESTTDTSPVQEPEQNTDPEPEPEEPVYTFTDPALPVVTPFYTQKYPNGLSGVWDQAKSGFTNSPFITFLNSFIPSWGGSCPQWSMSFAIGKFGSFGSIGFGDLCYVFAFVKACMMLGAVFFSRSAIFGG